MHWFKMPHQTNDRDEALAFRCGLAGALDGLKGCSDGGSSLESFALRFARAISAELAG